MQKTSPTPPTQSDHSNDQLKSFFEPSVPNLFLLYLRLNR